MMEGIISLRVVDGHVAGEQMYVYCWQHPHDGKAMYVGATWLHPAARAELHLHGMEAEARVVGEKLAPLGIDPKEPLTLLAFPVPDGMERQECRRALIAQLAQTQDLSAAYFGPAPESMRFDDASELGQWVKQVAETIKGRWG
jgi:hypothetical protein